MPAIVLDNLSKRYGAVYAVEALNARVRPGRTTALIGANGSGKTTTMRVLLGRSEPTSGRALIGEHRYAELRDPWQVVGAVLEPRFYPNRTAREHLRLVAEQAAVSRSRVEEWLALVGLANDGERRIGGYSAGMRRRLALASAMLGRPSLLVLDEPFESLDAGSVLTVRAFLRRFVDQGGTVFLSSKSLTEVAPSADDAIVVDHGRLVAAGQITELVTGSPRITVSSANTDLLAITLGSRGADVVRADRETLTVTGVSREDVGRAAADAGIIVTELRVISDDLDSVVQDLIRRGVSRQEYW
jgi:ABC-2 type transport system ATP-binding protein